MVNSTIVNLSSINASIYNLSILTVNVYGGINFINSSANVAIGNQALPISTGTNNTAIGIQSLQLNTTGYSNTAIGYQTLQSNTTGYNNVATGLAALLSNTDGSNNVATGSAALSSNTNGYNNIAIGSSALLSNTNGSNNVATGSSALRANLGFNNVASGTSALQGNTLGQNNVAIGANALETNIVGSNNVAVGQGTIATGSNNTLLGNNATVVGYSNSTAIGYNSIVNTNNQIMLGTSHETVWLPGSTNASVITSQNMYVTGTLFVNNIANSAANSTTNSVEVVSSLTNTTFGNGQSITSSGTYNSAYGFNALHANTSGNNNTAIGAYTLNTNTFGMNNTGIGYNSLNSNTTGQYNTAIGNNSLNANTLGQYNTAVGADALHSNTTGSNNVASGQNALYANNIGSNNVASGKDALHSNADGTNNIATGQNALYQNNAGSNNIASGQNALYINTTGNNNVAIGQQALYSNNDGVNNVATGYQAMQNSTAGSNNIASGYQALYTNTGSNNVASGQNALHSNTGSNNVANGSGALYSNTGDNNVAIGQQSLYSNTGYNNVATGFQALTNNTTGYQNIATGFQSLFTNTTGNNNVAIGSSALNSNTSGSSNIAIGDQTLQTNTYGYNNVAIGPTTLNANTTGQYNVAIGSNTLASNSNGSNNTANGRNALQNNTTGSNNTAIGRNALYNNTTSSNNTALGYNANTNNFSNSTAIGYNSSATANNQIVLGTSAETVYVPGIINTNNINGIGGSTLNLLATMNVVGSTVITWNNMVAIANPLYSTNISQNVGNVTLFDTTSGYSVPVLSVNGSATNDQIGTNIALSRDGQTLVIGSPNASSYRGRYTLYSKSNNWASAMIDQLGINPSGTVLNGITQQGDRYGTTVLVNASSTFMVVSSQNFSNNSGRVDTYCNTPSWSNTNSLNNIGIGTSALNINLSSSGSQAFFGTNIALNKSTLIIGSPYNKLGAGTVHSFFLNNTAPTLNILLYNKGNFITDSVGTSVAVSLDGTVGSMVNSSYNAGGPIGMVQTFKLGLSTYSNGLSSIGFDNVPNTGITGLALNSTCGISLNISHLYSATGATGKSQALSYNGTYLMIGFGAVTVYPGYLQIWNLVTQSNIINIIAYGLGANFAISDDGTTFASSSPYYNNNAGILNVWTIADNQLTPVLTVNGTTNQQLGKTLALSGTNVAITSGNFGYGSSTLYQNMSQVFNASGYKAIAIQNNTFVTGSTNMSVSAYNLSVFQPFVIASTNIINASISATQVTASTVYTNNITSPNTANSTLLFDKVGLVASTVLTSFDGSIIAMANPAYTSGSIVNAGQVLLYSKTNLNAPILTVNGSYTGDQFGTNIALSRDGATLAIGSPNAYSSRGRYTLYSSINNWTSPMIDVLGVTQTNGITQFGDRIGYSVAINATSTFAVVGNPYCNSSTGNASAYYSNGTNWTFAGGDSGIATTSLFGQNIALNATTLAIGSPSYAGWGLINCYWLSSNNMYKLPFTNMPTSIIVGVVSQVTQGYSLLYGLGNIVRVSLNGQTFAHCTPSVNSKFTTWGTFTVTSDACKFVSGYIDNNNYTNILLTSDGTKYLLPVYNSDISCILFYNYINNANIKIIAVTSTPVNPLTITLSEDGSTWGWGNRVSNSNNGNYQLWRLGGEGSFSLLNEDGIKNGFNGTNLMLSANGQQFAVTSGQNGYGRYKVYTKNMSVTAIDQTGLLSTDNIGSTIALSGDGTTFVVGSPSYNNNAGRVSIYSVLTSNNTVIGNNSWDTVIVNANGFNSVPDNVGIGLNCLINNIGSANTAFGDNTLSYTNSGNWNTAIGRGVLKVNTTGYSNTAIGCDALQSNTTGAYNIAIGLGALTVSTTGNSNTAIGFCLGNNISGNNNVAIGHGSLIQNIKGFSNTAIGCDSLHDNIGHANTAIGGNALYKNTTGYSNTAIGYDALSLSCGINNTGIGRDACRIFAGTGLESNNTCIGAGSNVIAGVSNSTTIGFGAVCTASNQIVLGTSAETVVIPNTISLRYSTLPTFTTNQIGCVLKAVLPTVYSPNYATLNSATTYMIIYLPIGVWVGTWNIYFITTNNSNNSVTHTYTNVFNESQHPLLQQSTGNNWYASGTYISDGTNGAVESALIISTTANVYTPMTYHRAVRIA